MRWFFYSLLAIVATVGIAAWVGKPHPLEIKVPVVVNSPGQDLRFDRIQNDIKRLSAAPSRVTGYPGCDQAFDLIMSELKQAGLTQIEVQEFPVVSPIVHGTPRLDVVTAHGAGASLPIHPLWPNMARTVQTPAEGITGPLVDVGKGTDVALNGKPIRDSIVVMDWDSNVEWLSVPEFGGKAVLFRANENGGYNATRNKFLTVPANIPRFYIAKEDLPALDRLLAQPGTKVSLHCDMSWERVTAKNILVKVNEGKAPAKGEDALDATPVVYHAYYDAISVVPDLAPGAEQACGPATMLELARFLAKLQVKPERPTYLLFTGGHGQSLSGMTHFVRSILDAQEKKDKTGSLVARMGQPGALIGLDLSSRSDRIGIFCVGSFRDQYENLLRPKFRTLGLKLEDYAKKFAKNEAAKQELPPFLDCINLTLGRGWWTYFPYRVAFESELPNIAAIPGVTLSTINDDRRHVDTPDDKFSDLKLDLFKRQICVEPDQRIGLANLVLATAFWKGPFVSSDLENHFARVNGRVVWLDQQKDYTPNQPLVNAPVFLKSMRTEKYLLGTRATPLVFTDEHGRFTLDGLIEATSAGNAAYLNCTLEAYGPASESFAKANPGAIAEFIKTRQKSDPNYKDVPLDGSIIYAMDMARPDEYPFKAGLLKKDVYLNLVCFPCKTFTLYGLTEPRGYIGLRDIQLLDAATQSPPFQFGRSSSDTAVGNSDENCITIWADPATKLRLTLGFGLQEKRLILINNSQEDPIGQGFVLDQLDNIPSMVLRGAQDMFYLDQSRMGKFEKYGITNPRVHDIHAEAEGYIKKAEAALAQNDYMTYRSTAEKGWALESKAYSELLAMTNDMIRGVLFYLALLLPFAYCIERLIFASGTIRRRIILMATIFIGSFGLLAYIHPAFRFTLTPLIVLLAFIILALAVTVSLLVVGKFDAMLQERKASLSGQHEDAQNVGNIAVRAVDLGIANIRRRPQRGFLTGMTIVLVTFTLLSFTSLVPEVSVSKLKHPLGTPVYNGMLARDRGWAPMPGPLYESLQRTFDQANIDLANLKPEQSVIATRAWYYSDTLGNLSMIDLLPAPKTAAGQPAAADAATTAVKHFTAVALLGMEPTEPAISGIDKTLLAGRWFKNREEDGIILPKHIATQLGLDLASLGQKVQVFGQALPVIGIFDEKKMDAWKDIDGEPLTPVNFALEVLTEAKKDTTTKPDTIDDYIHYTSDQVAIVPLKFAIRLGATYRSFAIKMGPAVDPNAQAEGYARRSNLSILASNGKDVLLYSMMDRNKLNAAGQIIIPVLLGFMMVLGTMLGSVYERRREIFIYNSVGLSPTNVATLFLAESSVYAIIGACMGYLLGQVVSKVMLHTHLLSGMGLNYSAGTTIFVTLLTMGIVILSTLYPMRQAFRAAIPDTHKDADADDSVDLQTGSISTFLPFVATPSSVYAMQAYMHEYLDGLQGITIGQLAIDNLKAEVEVYEGREIPLLTFRAWLAPFDLGISHDAQLRIVYRADRGVYQYHLKAQHFSGDQQNWRRLTPRFVLSVRKQLLMWRILPSSAHASYADKALGLFGQNMVEETNHRERSPLAESASWES